MALDYAASEQARTIEFRGYAYTRTPSEISGQLMTRYDEKKPQIWKVPLRDDVRPSVQVDAPKAGYIVPAAWAQQVAARLDVHGVSYRRIERALPQLPVQTFRAASATFASRPVNRR